MAQAFRLRATSGDMIRILLQTEKNVGHWVACNWMRRALTVAVTLLAISGAGGGLRAAGQRRGGPPPGPPPPPRAGAPIDLTGYWVSVVNEDWRWRMLTPEKGDFTSVPLNAKGQEAAKAWNPATDGSCLAYGIAGLMRMPMRVHITWESDTVLKIETDAGRQVRRLLFDKPSGAPAPAPRSERSPQGLSIAEWQRTLPPGGIGGFFRGGPPPPGGSLKVVTTNVKAGWLRKNGVPYSENAVVTEYFDRFPAPDATEWFVVTTTVEDPTYLTGPFVTSSHFRKEPDGSKWNAQPCKPPAS